MLWESRPFEKGQPVRNPKPKARNPTLEGRAIVLPRGPTVISSFLGLPHKILKMNPIKELLWGLRVEARGTREEAFTTLEPNP